MNSATRRAGPRWLSLILLTVLLYALLAFGLYANVTSRVPGANDFYSRWAGARAMLVQYENPYSEAVTRQIQMGMLGRLSRPGESPVAFSYPLYAAFAAAPLVTLAYPAAEALWMALLILAALLGSFLLAQLYMFPLTPGRLVALGLGALAFYPSVRGIFLGQYALLAFLFVSLAFLAIRSEKDWWGGALLALATVKPQVVAFLLPGILAWAVLQRRWGIIYGAVGALLVLTGLGMVWQPLWPLDFIRAVGQYAADEKVGPPLQTAVEWFVPGPASTTLAVLVAIGLLGWTAMQIARSVRTSWSDMQPTLHWIAIVTTLAAGRIGTPDQIILLMPWIYWIGEWVSLRQWSLALMGVLSILVVPWAFFLATLQGNAENVVVTVVLPFLTLGTWLTREFVARKVHAGAL